MTVKCSVGDVQLDMIYYLESVFEYLHQMKLESQVKYDWNKSAISQLNLVSVGLG